jgi:hypothetical protein
MFDFCVFVVVRRRKLNSHRLRAKKVGRRKDLRRQKYNEETRRRKQ